MLLPSTALTAGAVAVAAVCVMTGRCTGGYL